VLNACHIPLLYPLQRQRRNQRCPNTRSIFCSQDLNRVLLAGLLVGPVQDLAERNGPALLEVRVLVEDGSVGANVAGLVTFLLADGGNATGRKASCARANQFGQTTNELQLWGSSAEAEFVLKELRGLGEILMWISVGQLVGREE
jgi:hypothetical protein